MKMIQLFRPALTLGLLCAALAPAHAQAVTNGGFETWAVRGTANSPTGWLTIDDFIFSLLGIPLPSDTFTKSTDAHGGTYALRLESKNTLLGVMPGAVAIGPKIGNNGDTPGGVPFSGRPTALQFYYKLSGPQPATASDGAFAQVALTRTVGGVVQLIATGKQIFATPAAAYTLGQVPLTYASSAAPDSVRLVFSSGAVVTASGTQATNDTAGTVFQVDDLIFTGTATATRDAALAAALTVAPNPSQSGRYVLRAAPSLLAAPLAVVDATGRTVHREGAPAAGTATRPLDLAGLATGVYTLQVFTTNGLITKKLVVE